MSLPGYAFDRKRYWVPTTSTAREGEAFKETRLHPLLHRNESTLRGQIYGSSFNGEEVVLRDHRIGGQKVLCGAAELELALAAASLALGRIGARSLVTNETSASGSAASALLASSEAAGEGAPLVSSVKPATGHLGAGAGALNLAVAALAVHHQQVPPTLNLHSPDPVCDGLDFLANEARQAPVAQALALARGLEGQNVAMAVRAV